MLGSIDSKQDARIALEFCEQIDELRDDGYANDVIREVVSKKLDSISTKYPNLKITIEQELIKCHPTMWN